MVFTRMSRPAVHFRLSSHEAQFADLTMAPATEEAIFGLLIEITFILTYRPQSLRRSLFPQDAPCSILWQPGDDQSPPLMHLKRETPQEPS